MSKVKIISAAYGTKSAALVVTEKVQKLVDKGETRIAASNKLFGDPSPGHTKHLAINYSFNGVKLAGACKEHQTVAIASFPNANWMSRINGNRRLSEINMPGTHDSCAAQCGQRAWTYRNQARTSRAGFYWPRCPGTFVAPAHAHKHTPATAPR